MSLQLGPLARRLVVAGSLTLASIAGAQSRPGFTYTIRVTGSAPGGMPGISGGAGSLGYTGHAMSLATRGRMDITDGSVEGLFAKGDYLLYDSTDIVVVHPGTKTFTVVTRDAQTHAIARLDSLGFKVRLSDEKVALDSIGRGDTISGVATQRFRLTMAFNMAMDAGVVQQRIGSETVTEYWTGVVPDFPPNPLLRSNAIAGAGMTGMFKDLSTRVDSVSRRIAHVVPLRTVSTTRIIAGPGQMMESRQSSEMSELKRAPVDPALLVLPADYKAEALPGVDSTPSNDPAKWRVRPLR